MARGCCNAILIVSPIQTAHRQERPVLTGPHQCWSMDFVSDQLFDGRRFRALTLVDNYSRECLEIEVGQSLKGFDVVDEMERIKQVRGVIPKRIQVDNVKPTPTPVTQSAT